jgi:hypothetical protein
MEAAYSPPYSPAYPVENFGRSEAIGHAAEVTGAQEGWSAATIEREKKAAMTKKAGRGRGRKHRKTKKAGKRRVGRARPQQPEEDTYHEENLELLQPGGRRRTHRTRR